MIFNRMDLPQAIYTIHLPSILHEQIDSKVARGADIKVVCRDILFDYYSHLVINQKNGLPYNVKVDYNRTKKTLEVNVCFK